MRLSRVLFLTCCLLAAFTHAAFADATAFVGSTTTPSNHTTKGFAIGVGLVIVGVEFEFASTSENTLKGAPQVRTGMGNAYVQTPVEVAGLRFYATAGGGGYRETLGTTHRETHIAFNTGGGVKVSLLGPLKARIDYRVFRLRGAPLYPTLHRVYAGVNLAF